MCVVILLYVGAYNSLASLARTLLPYAYLLTHSALCLYICRSVQQFGISRANTLALCLLADKLCLMPVYMSERTAVWHLSLSTSSRAHLPYAYLLIHFALCLYIYGEAYWLLALLRSANGEEHSALCLLADTPCLMPVCTGCSLYYDLLTEKNSKKYFIDKTRALDLLGVGCAFFFYYTPFYHTFFTTLFYHTLYQGALRLALKASHTLRPRTLVLLRPHTLVRRFVRTLRTHPAHTP